MSKFDTKLNELRKLRNKVSVLENELGRQIENHLGEGWFITFDVGDGILLLSPVADNYEIGTYVECQHMPRDEAIEYIEARPFN